MADISVIRNSILNYELSKRTNDPDKELNASEIKGKGHLDADSSGEISSRELTEAAKRAGVDISTLTKDEKTQLLRELSTFSKQGGSFAVSETEPNSFTFKITPPFESIKSGKPDADGNIQTLSKGASGPAVRKLEKLLANLNYRNIGDKFGDDAEKYVKHFQLNSMFTKDLTTGEMKPKPGFEDVKLGVVDAKTIRAMEESTKMENPYQSSVPSRTPNVVTEANSSLPQTTSTSGNNNTTTPQPATNTPSSQPTQNTTQTSTTSNAGAVSNREVQLSPGEFGQFERVNNNVRNHLVDTFKNKGLSLEEAERKADESLQLGNSLAKEGIRQDKSMSSNNMCYTSVKNNFVKTMDIPYQRYTNRKGGDHARTASDTLFAKNPEKFTKLSIPRADVQYLPPGAVVVYHPASKAEAGHIGVQTAQLKTPAQSRHNTAQGLPITSYQVQDGKIIGLDVQVGKNNLKYTVQDGKVFDPSGKPTELTIDHADLSDVQRNNPWASANVDVFFPTVYK
jgi:hypothetical protein